MGSFQKRFSGFFPFRGSPPPLTPLTENHFDKKPLAERGGTPLPPLTENFRKFFSKNRSKRAKIGVFWPKIAAFWRIFSYTELGVPPPLTESHCAQKSLAEWGGPPPP